MGSIQNGPNQAYADEYTGVSNRIDDVSTALAAKIEDNGFQSRSLAASVRSDPVNIKGDFPHKTAATRAGLGLIGHHCQLIMRLLGYGSGWRRSLPIWRCHAENRWKEISAAVARVAWKPAPQEL